MSIPLSSSAELRAFDATARSGSMSAAAKLLGLRQPTVSAHIASLERNYGVELFHRRGSRIELTGFGAMLREVTHRIFRGEEQAAALLLGARSSYEGAEWSRPVFAGERPVYIRLPTFGFGPRRRQTAVTLNRSQRSSTCRALSFSARSLRSPLRSNMA
jgi:DNA-binding transcriptional ArsR family regulator